MSKVHWWPPELSDIVSAWNAGERARDWPRKHLEQMVQFAVGKWQGAYVGMIAYFMELDSGNLYAAQVHIARSVNDAGRFQWQDPEFVPRLEFEQVFVNCLLRSRLENIDAPFIRYDWPMDTAEMSQIRAQAALCAVRNRHKEAAELIDQAKADIYAKYPEIKPNIQAELDWLDLIKL
jgi:hypothetical protein